MLLIGMLTSPYVRPVAISLRLLGVAFNHANWSIGKDFARIREVNPLGRVPALVTDEDGVVVESAAILDYLDHRVGADRALLPLSGRARRDALQIAALAQGAADKGREQVYETVFRPPEKRHEPWVARCHTQMHGALAELERRCAQRAPNEWLISDRITRAEVVLTCAFTFVSEAVGLTEGEAARYPALRALAARCEALPAFRSTRASWVVPLAPQT